MPKQPPKSPLSAARLNAMDYLARRDHSKQELKLKLKKKGHALEDITQAITELDQKGLINESRFTENFIRYKRNRGFGPERIQLELNARGIDDATIAEQLRLADNGWSNDARKVWQKHFKGKYPENYAEKAKQMRFLQYRGFNREQISSIFKEEEIST